MAAVGNKFIGRSNLFTALRVQGSVIGALMLRELHTRYGKRGLGMLWFILEPAILAVMVVAMKSYRHSGMEFPGVEVVPFVILGYVNFMMFRSIFNRAESTIDANATLLYHRMVSILDMLVSRALLEAISTAALLIVMMTVVVSMEAGHPPVRLFDVIVGFLLLWWMSFALSLVVCAWTYDKPSIQKLIHPFTYIMLPLSGAFFMVQWTPTKYHGLMVWWPPAICFEEIRYGWFEGASNRFVDISYVVIFGMVIFVLGLISLGELRKKIVLS